MFGIHALGPLWALRLSALPPPSGLPVFQTLNHYSIAVSEGNLNTVDSYNPFQDDHVLAMRIDPIDINQGTTPYIGDDGRVLYDPKTDNVFAVTTDFTPPDKFVYRVDTREAAVVWQYDFTTVGNTYTSVELIGVTPLYVWVKALNASSEFVFFSLDIATGTLVHNIILPDTHAFHGGGTLSSLWSGWRLALSDTKISIGLGTDTGTSENYMVTLDVTGPTSGTLDFLDLNGAGVANYYPDSIWSFYDGKAYVANSQNTVAPGIPLFQVIDLNTMTITDINTTLTNDQFVYVYEMFLNEDKTRLYASDQGDDSRMLEFDITTPGWTFLGSYGTNTSEAGNGMQADKYYYASGYIFGATYNGEVYTIWSVGDYGPDAPYASSGWYGYRNYAPLFNYNVAPLYVPWNQLTEPTHQPGKCTGVWILPSPTRTFTAPTYPTVPPTLTGTLVDGTNNLTLTEPVQWYSYEFAGFDSMQFEIHGGFTGPVLHIFDSDGRPLMYRNENIGATITRSLCLPGTYYVAVFTQLDGNYLRGTQGWTMITQGPPDGAITLDITPGVTEG